MASGDRLGEDCAFNEDAGVDSVWLSPRTAGDAKGFGVGDFAGVGMVLGVGVGVAVDVEEVGLGVGVGVGVGCGARS